MIRLDLFVELLETFELRCEAAFGGGVDDQDDFVFEVGERKGLAFLCEWERRVSRGGVQCAVVRDMYGGCQGEAELSGDGGRMFGTYYQEV